MENGKLAQDDADKQNEAFWNEPCGTSAAKVLGIDGTDTEALKKYDEFFFGFYPYLKGYIDVGKEDNFLEVGLGYGSVSQYLMEQGGNGTFLDIAVGPVELVKKRASNIGYKKGSYVTGSILAPPQDLYGTMDKIVAIGCLHHTGDCRKAIESCRKLLSENGTLIFMVYNAFSYRQFLSNFISFVSNYRKLEVKRSGYSFYGDQDANAVYDKNQDGSAAPSTEFLSKRKLQEICRGFKEVHIQSENISQTSELVYGTRERSLNSYIAKNFGTDLYVVCKKS